MSGVREADDAPARRLVGVGCVLLSAFLIAVTPNAAKIAYQEGANPLAVITFRCVLGTAGLALYLSVRKRWPQEGWKTFRKSFLTGLTQAFTALGFLGAVAFIDVSLAAQQFRLRAFDAQDMYFGALNVAGIDPAGKLHALADTRRHGAEYVSPAP